MGKVRTWWEARRARKATISEKLARSEPPSRLDRLDGRTPITPDGSAGSHAETRDKPTTAQPDRGK
jgi:hypothetical protein